MYLSEFYWTDFWSCPNVQLSVTTAMVSVDTQLHLSPWRLAYSSWFPFPSNSVWNPSQGSELGQSRGSLHLFFISQESRFFSPVMSCVLKNVVSYIVLSSFPFFFPPSFLPFFFLPFLPSFPSPSPPLSFYLFTSFFHSMLLLKLGAYVNQYLLFYLNRTSSFLILTWIKWLAQEFFILTAF